MPEHAFIFCVSTSTKQCWSQKERRRWLWFNFQSELFYKWTNDMHLLCLGYKRIVTINKSMIHFNDCTVEFVQYVLWKPINMGLAQFVALWWSFIFGLKFVVTKRLLLLLQPLQPWNFLINEAGLISIWGCILYMNNRYTWIPLAKMLFGMYQRLFCGTFVPTKNSCMSWQGCSIS